MAELIRLRPDETRSGDVDRFLGADARPGSEHLEHVYGPTLEQLAEALSRVSIAYRDGRMIAMTAAARQASDQASAVGLNRLSRVARTVCVLAGAPDGTALAANVARLMRLGEDSLESIWQLHDSRY